MALDAWASGGKPVTIPPEIGHGPSPEVEVPRAAPLPAAGNPPPGVTADGAVWSTTGTDQPSRNRTPLLIGASAGGLFLLGLLAVGGYFLFRSKPVGEPTAIVDESALGAPPAESAPPVEIVPPPVQSTAPPATASSERENEPKDVARTPPATGTKTETASQGSVRSPTGTKTSAPTGAKTATPKKEPTGGKPEDFGY
jgi:hypothetical protein